MSSMSIDRQMLAYDHLTAVCVPCSTSGDQTGTIPHVFSLSDLKFDLGMDEDNHAALGDSMINTESLDNL